MRLWTRCARDERALWSFALGFALLSSAACGKKDNEATAEAPVPAATPTTAKSGFDLGAIPMAKDSLPAFPFVEWPEYVDASARQVEAQAALDAVKVIAGAQLLTVEGRLERRSFSIPSGKSTLELRRYYRDRITALGGVQVNTVQPVNDAAVVVESVRTLFPADADPAKQLGLQRYDEGQYQYEVYVVRTPTKNAWFVVQTSTYSVVVTAIEATAK
jgi:hypothetical protein